MATVREPNDTPDRSDANTAADSAGEESTRSEMHKLRNKLRANGAELEEQLRDASERFAHGAKTFGAAAAEQMRAHPLATFGIAFAAGVVVSRWLRDR